MNKVVFPVVAATVLLAVSGAQAFEPLLMPPVYYNAGGGAWDMYKDDFTGDGIPDLAVACTSWPYGWSMLSGNRNGSFSEPVFYATMSLPSAVYGGDFDGDNDVDVAVTREYMDDVLIFMNDGGGTYSIASSFPAGNAPVAICGGDLDGDGHCDLATANAYSSDYSILRGNGDGSFGAPANYGGGFYPYAVSLVDVDRDNDLDLIGASYYAYTVSVYRNNGNGLFMAPVDYPNIPGAARIVSCDLDSDGDPDLAIASSYGNTAVILMNNGDGSFAAPVGYAAGTWPWAIACGDLDMDHDPDLAVANYGSNDVVVLLNNGDGTFPVYEEDPRGDPVQGPPSFPVNPTPRDLFLSDVDTDGDNDVIVACQDSQNIGVLINYAVPVETMLHACAARAGDEGIEVSWVLSGSDGSVDFVVYRQAGGDGSFCALDAEIVQSAERAFNFADVTCDPGVTYRYKVDVVDRSGQRVLFVTDPVTAIRPVTALSQNWPNPFNPSTTIRYALPVSQQVTLEICDVAGRRIALLVNGKEEAGRHVVEWRGTDATGQAVSSGVYFCNLTTGSENLTRKMLLMR